MKITQSRQYITLSKIFWLIYWIVPLIIEEKKWIFLVSYLELSIVVDVIPFPIFLLRPYSIPYKLRNRQLAMWANDRERDTD